MGKSEVCTPQAKLLLAVTQNLNQNWASTSSIDCDTLDERSCLELGETAYPVSSVKVGGGLLARSLAFLVRRLSSSKCASWSRKYMTRTAHHAATHIAPMRIDTTINTRGDEAGSLFERDFVEVAGTEWALGAIGLTLTSMRLLWGDSGRRWRLKMEVTVHSRCIPVAWVKT